MGVKGLWQLLIPIGRKVSIESLDGKILAVDASIWLVQFINAMRDSDGELIKNAHLLGTIRRILKLLYHRIYPVFVFDGETPTLKLKTSKSRKQSRDIQEIKKRQIFEQTLLDQVKNKIILSNNDNLLEEELHADDEVVPINSKIIQNQNSKFKLGIIGNVQMTLLRFYIDNRANDSGSDIDWEENNISTNIKDISDNFHQSSDDEFDWDLPDEDLNPEALAALPFQIKKSVIEEVRRKERQKKRASYLPVLGNPVLYSQTQLANFIRSSKLNSTIFEAQKILEKDSNGLKIASDGNKLYTMHKISDDLSKIDNDTINIAVNSHNDDINDSHDIDPFQQYKDIVDRMKSVPKKLDENEKPTEKLQISFKIDVLNTKYQENNNKIEKQLSIIDNIDNDNSDNDIEWESDSVRSTNHNEEDIKNIKENSNNETTITKEEYHIVSTESNKNVISDVVNKAITTASKMGDWAGRVVNKEFKKYKMTQMPVPKEYNITDDNVDSLLCIESSKLNNSSTRIADNVEIINPQRFNQNINANANNNNNNNSKSSHFKDDNEMSFDDMKNDIIKLLQVFDLPFIIAPFEAEAQCAVLEQLGLVDGIITEDSDVFLFGGKTIYKNIFQDKKFVEVYRSEDAYNELGIDRNDFVSLAFLLGSDYTDGVKGIGIVNAMEILEAFNMKSDEGPYDTLVRFKHWLDDESSYKNILTSSKIKEQVKKRKIKNFDGVDDNSEQQSDSADDLDDKKLLKFDKKHRAGKSNWTVSSNFPDVNIIDAYRNPKANYENTDFQWIMPKLHRIRTFCRDKLYWTDKEMDLNIDPVIEKLSKKSYQPRIDSYFLAFHDNKRFGDIKSSRLENAVAQIRDEIYSERLIDTPYDTPIYSQSDTISQHDNSNLAVSMVVGGMLGGALAFMSNNRVSVTDGAIAGASIGVLSNIISNSPVVETYHSNIRSNHIREFLEEQFNSVNHDVSSGLSETVISNLPTGIIEQTMLNDTSSDIPQAVYR
eukprot:gene17794-23402_t